MQRRGLDAMRYTEPKDRSAELLRLALGHMGRHAAAFNPLTFTLWYEFAAGVNPQLQAAIEQLVRDKTSLDDEAVTRLYAEHIASADDASLRRISGEMQRVMGSIADSASAAGDRAGRFGAQLDDLSAALQANDVKSLSPQLSDALAGTQQMKDSAQALQQQVQASRTRLPSCAPTSTAPAARR